VFQFFLSADFLGLQERGTLCVWEVWLGLWQPGGSCRSECSQARSVSFATALKRSLVFSQAGEQTCTWSKCSSLCLDSGVPDGTGCQSHFHLV